VDKYKIDSHKLNYHISTLNKWLLNKTIYPIYVEVSPSGTCNHRCSFCALDFMEYQKIYLDLSILEKRLYEMSDLGVRSIMFAGEGEPLLHKKISDLIILTKKAGIDVALTTNGVLLKKDLSELIIPHMEWIKISVNAGTKETYSKIHQTKERDFEKVINNLKDAIRIKKENNFSCVLGMQMVLLPENQDEVILLAKQAKDIQLDYLVIKPYSHHYCSKTNLYQEISYKNYYSISEKLEEFNSNDFNVVFRINTMKKWDNKEKGYEKCLALPFWAYIDAGGNVWGCSAYLQNEKFKYGNVYEDSFQNIWNSEKRIKCLQWVENELDIDQCRTNCRMDNVNRYLWDLKHPPRHVNFI